MPAIPNRRKTLIITKARKADVQHPQEINPELLEQIPVIEVGQVKEMKLGPPVVGQVVFNNREQPQQRRVNKTYRPDYQRCPQEIVGPPDAEPQGKWKSGIHGYDYRHQHIYKDAAQSPGVKAFVHLPSDALIIIFMVKDENKISQGSPNQANFEIAPDYV